MPKDNDQSNSAKWWQTLPGLLTAFTASISAIAGLIAVLHQTGWLASATPDPSEFRSNTAAASTHCRRRGGRNT